jgi:hypothetical protein
VLGTGSEKSKFTESEKFQVPVYQDFAHHTIILHRMRATRIIDSFLSNFHCVYFSSLSIYFWEIETVFNVRYKKKLDTKHFLMFIETFL